MAISSTATVLINAALERLGVKSAGETVSASDMQAGLRSLQLMVDSWALQPGTITYETREVFDLVANQASYTIGPSANFNTVRPVWITGAGLLLTASDPDVEIPLGLLTDNGWQSIAQKALTSTQPTQLYFNATAPSATINLWPIPDNATNDLVLYSLKAFVGFTDLATSVSMPTGYAEAIEYNLALRLQAPFGQEMGDDDKKLARKLLASVKRSNAHIVDMALDPALTIGGTRPYNILAGP